jgi:hypothetical protein
MLQPFKDCVAAHRFIRRSAFLLCALFVAGGAQAALPDAAMGRMPFVEGGIGLDDVQLMDAQRSAYALALRTAALGSGAYLADVHVRISDAAGVVVFERQLQGPWLLIDLPAGRYEIVGIHEGVVERQGILIPARGHREAVLYFPVQGERATHRVGDD